MVTSDAGWFRRALSPQSYDRGVAARTSSLFCWMAAFWFFVTPWTFFGVSAQSSAWNAWIVGGVMVIASMIRISHPEHTAGFSMLNVVLSIWVIISPFVFGYTHDTSRLVNTLSVGATILCLSLISLLVTKGVDSKLETPEI